MYLKNNEIVLTPNLTANPILDLILQSEIIFTIGFRIIAKQHVKDPFRVQEACNYTINQTLLPSPPLS